MIAPPIKKVGRINKVNNVLQKNSASVYYTGIRTKYTTAELIDAKLLAAVHCSDLKYGSQNRNWKLIQTAAAIPGTESSIWNRFKEIKSPTPMWFPYPPIPLNQFVDVPISCERLPGMVPTEYEYDQTYGDKPWADGVDRIRRSALVVEPWAMQTWQIQHYLGYFEKPRNHQHSLDVYEDRFMDALVCLPRNVLAKYATYNRGDESAKSDDEIETELEKLIREFEEDDKDAVKAVNLGQAVCVINDVSYYRRKVYDSFGIFERNMLSDYEMVKLYVKGAEANFDFESTEYEYWEAFLEINGVGGIPVREARQDFFKYCVPRMELLRPHLAMDKDHVQLSIRSNVSLACMIVYHCSDDVTFYGLLKTMYLLQKKNVIDMCSFGTTGLHHSAFCFMLLILQCDFADFWTDDILHNRGRAQVVHDLLTNYKRFHCNNFKFC